MDGVSFDLTQDPLLAVRDLAVTFKVSHHREPLRAVDTISFDVGQRETVGLVGESGSGKTTIGRAILGLTPVAEGSISFAGRDITHAGYRQRRRLAAYLQAVFQDPYSSLNPTRTIGQTLAEPLRAQGSGTRAEISERVREMLDRVGLPADVARRYPSHFSGGQRQRIAIARALMVGPRLVICDEPTSSLDLSVQAQALNLLRTLQESFDLSYLFISHDLAVVRHLAHRVVVLYRGRVMEEGEAKTLYSNPVHPYTYALLNAAPVPDPEHQRKRRRLSVATGIAGESEQLPANSCPFAPRCTYAVTVCRESRPALERTTFGSQVACHRWRELIGDSSFRQRLESTLRPIAL